MKKVRKMLPVSISDITGMEKWLEDQADNGLFPVSIGSWAAFTAGGIPGTRFRLEPYGKCQDAPTEEQLTLYRNAGWEYAFAVGSIYFLFYTTDPAAVELYSDHESRGLSLERLEKAVWRARRRSVITYSVLAAAIVWMLFFYEDRLDVQPDHLASLPLVLLRLFNPGFLILVAGQIFLSCKNSRDIRLLQKTCKALKDGMAPPPSPGPDKKIIFENVMSVVAVIPLLVLLPGQWFNWFSLYSDIPLDHFRHSYIGIQQIEHTPVYQWNDLFEHAPSRNASGIYCADVEHSLLAPVWYSVTQEAYSPQDGTSGAFSPDPENEANRYSPQLEATYFHLLIPSMSRQVAEAQMNAYRLINLDWSYEYMDFPDLDFVILADEPDGIWQMAALGRGKKVAVFLYGGQEDLREHLDTLAAFVM